MPGKRRTAQLQKMQAQAIPMDLSAQSTPMIDVCDRLQGLAPVADARTKLLIVGSFPSVASLRAQQYYAHAQNKLWTILAALWPQFAQPTRDDYAARCEWLLARGLGLWDVYASCERQGSLDARIRHPVCNDFAALEKRCPQLSAVAHNGSESYKHACRLESLGWQTYKLPSTSAANAAWSLERKVAAWRAAMQAVDLLEKET